MKVVILCGGKGIRAFPFTEYLPKPMMPLQGSPILVHVIRLFIAQGFNEFILAAGHRKGVLDDYFEGKDLGANVQVVDTGDEADTGDRIYAVRDMVGERFLTTYGDGLAQVRLDDLMRFHDAHDGMATMTCAPLYSQYGVVDMSADGKIVRMREKPRMSELWLNAGFFVFDRKVFDAWPPGSLESVVLPSLIEQGLAYGYRMDGFFKSMDSYKDQQEFESLLDEAGQPPWLSAP